MVRITFETNAQHLSNSDKVMEEVPRNLAAKETSLEKEATMEEDEAG